MRHEVQFLVDDRDASGLSFERGAEVAFDALVDNGAAVGRVLAADDFHQRGLARAIFAANGVNFAAPQVEADTVEGKHPGETFGHVGQAKQLSVFVSARCALRGVC